MSANDATNEAATTEARGALVFGEALAYAPATETTADLPIGGRQELFIDGHFTAPAGSRYRASTNPTTGEAITEVADADAADVERAVIAAHRAFEGPWSALRPIDRAKYIFRIARVIQEKTRELALLATLDAGQPTKETRDVDVPQAAAHFFYYAGWADKLAYAVPGRKPRPLGVVGQMVPAAFPLLAAARKIAPALAAGNTCVLIPAESAPLAALALARIIEECELPRGVVNVVTGGEGARRALVTHPGVSMIAFSGTSTGGKAVQRLLSERTTRMSLELGGNGANLVFADAALDQAVEAVIATAFLTQPHVGQAMPRLLVEEGVHERVVRKLMDRMATLRVGDPLDKNTDIGPVSSPEVLAHIEELVNEAEADGLVRYSHPQALPAKGNWFPPTLFTGVAQSHRISMREAVGPVLAVQTFRTPDEAVEKANNTPFGYSAGVWTSRGSKGLWVAERLRVGTVAVNASPSVDASSPAGFTKESGMGCQGGRQGLVAHLDVE